ncbi:hypothetical protein FO440_24150 [Mucilaginibacter corticis]|uniref:Uncharacterized protein n=1 Tax=Mucilaginibacter corticis TaxID=2597670 RepID=A0A556M4T0_9SPHI|nr:hypothetical protein [Mucilaginibacter corticis]TSJ34903.1 hypothetical protein FO440_24150 [Mucilaginibacter corticis]
MIALYQRLFVNKLAYGISFISTSLLLVLYTFYTTLLTVIVFALSFAVLGANKYQANKYKH